MPTALLHPEQKAEGPTSAFVPYLWLWPLESYCRALGPFSLGCPPERVVIASLRFALRAAVASTSEAVQMLFAPQHLV